MKLQKVKSGFFWALAFVLVASAGTYFRTYSLHQVKPQSAARLLAALAVEKEMVETFKKQLSVESPHLAENERINRARELARKEILGDQSAYERNIDYVVKEYASQLPKSSGRRYLLESDSYYYYSLTQKLIQNGKISDQVRNGQYFNPLMNAPEGYWAPLTWHPFVGQLIGNIARLIKPGMEWMEALAWTPIVLSVIVCFCFMILARVLRMSVFAAFVGATSLVLSPIFLQRSEWGWYDTDPYNYIFPLSILSCIVFGILNQKKATLFAVLAGFLTGLYALFWTGWPFIFILIPTALCVAYRLVLCQRQDGSASQSYLGKQSLYYLVSAVVFLSLFLTPKGLFDSVELGWDILKRFALLETDVWPNIFLTVGEARGATLVKLVAISGNGVTFLIALVGLFMVSYRVWSRQEKADQGSVFFLLFLTLPLFLMALKTERFAILFVIPLSIWVMYGADWVQNWVKEKSESARSGYVSFAFRFLAPLFLIIFLVPSLAMAHWLCLAVKPIMDDAWYDTMQDMKEKTPPQSIIYSWWPPGYFIASLAERRVVADGGTQQMHQNLWLAKILASQDEVEAAGLLRMMSGKGNEAVHYLETLGFNISQAVDMILSVVPLPLEQAKKKLPSSLSDDEQNKILSLTHPENKTPAYVLVYTDMIKQSLAVTVVSYWDFSKALAYKKKGWIKNLLRGGAENPEQNLSNLTLDKLYAGNVVEADEVKGDTLHYPNGILFNTKEWEALLEAPGKMTQPKSIFYMKDGRLEEKLMTGSHLDVSVLIVKEGDQYRTVLADGRLIRSLMFRLYYLRGEGLNLFELFSWHSNPLNGDQVGVYKLKD